jgi:hypothetical protein
MSEDDTASVSPAERHSGHVDTDGSRIADYDSWSDERLVDGYRRNSRILREYGTDRSTIHALCAIEERLRARDIDPEAIVADLED